MEERFYYCETCGNLLFAAIASGVTPSCCGDEMSLLHPNEQEGNGEKHLPVVEREDNDTLRVKVGTIPHPMSKEHGIRFICVETDLGIIIRYLGCEEEPNVIIKCTGTPKAVYAYCNLHGLWRLVLKPK